MFTSEKGPWMPGEPWRGPDQDFIEEDALLSDF